MTDATSSRLAGRLSRFGRDNRGNVAMIFGLSLLPLLGAVGLAIDFGNVMAARTKAQMATDAAVLQAAGVARDLIKTGDGSPSATTAAITDAKKRAAALFKAHADQSKLSNATFAIDIVRTGQTISASGSFAITSTNYFGPLFNQDTFRSTGTADSSASLPNYSDVYIAVDVSQSMGIASTQAGMNTLYNARIKKTNGTTAQTSCVFGCHAVENDNAESMEAVAKRNNVPLRIDVLRDATKKMIATASDDADSAPIYRLGLYAMGMNANYSNSKLIEVMAISNNFTLLTAAAQTIDLGPSPGNGYSDSYLNENVKDLSKLVPASADGSTMTNAKKYAFIITDGVRDIQSGSQCKQTGNRCVSALDTASCDDMKKKGVTVGVLYTTYSKINPIAPGTDWYQVQVVDTDVAAKIAPQLQACASPGWYFQASDGDAIDAAMQKMFSQTTYAPTLTN